MIKSVYGKVLSGFLDFVHEISDLAITVPMPELHAKFPTFVRPPIRKYPSEMRDYSQTSLIRNGPISSGLERYKRFPEAINPGTRNLCRPGRYHSFYLTERKRLSNHMPDPSTDVKVCTGPNPGFPEAINPGTRNLCRPGRYQSSCLTERSRLSYHIPGSERL
ncbi:hypothetical protein Ddc_13301 [Ditylenchus destructor]|nr:hypothetical protein Ddc_13301 [Ditylenchus destructor]